MTTRRPALFRTTSLMLGLVSLLVMTACSLPGQDQQATSTPPPGRLLTAFTQASQHYHVPQAVLLAVAYSETQWRSTLPSSVFGIMALYDTSRHDGTLTQAAQLTGASADALQHDPATNIAGAAAVLAADAGGNVSADNLNAWYGAVAKYSGLRSYEPAKWYAEHIYALLAKGVSGTADSGEALTLAPQTVQPDPSQLDALHLPHLQHATSDYPKAGAVFVTQNGYASANRPADGTDIRYIIIHDTEENYRNTVRLFTDPNTCCTANYVVDGADGAAFPTVSQFVFNHDIAYQAGNHYYNDHGIGIEHIGYGAYPAMMYTPAMYDASAQLVAYLCWKYAIPLDRAHILGHGNLPGPTTQYQHLQHYDPAQSWDWPYFMARVGDFYAQWSGNAAPPASQLDAQYLTPRASIRTIALHHEHNTLNDVAAWSAMTYNNYTAVYADDNGKPGTQLILGASDPATAVDAQHFSAADFTCDNVPTQTVGDPANPAHTAYDLRAKAEDGESFALLGTATSADGTPWDKIDFNGVLGWIKASDTQDGWGALATFTNGTAVYGAPGDSRICSDGANGFSRAGQRYIVLDVANDTNGAYWFGIFYNHRVVWVPASEVTVG